MHLYGFQFTQEPLSPSRHAEQVKRLNPLGRVPALVLDDGEVLVESMAILDYLDSMVEADLMLTPRDGSERRQVLRIAAYATTVMEKITSAFYEQTRRPTDRVYRPWVEKCHEQAEAGLCALDGWVRVGSWMVGDRMTQAEVSTVVAMEFIPLVSPDFLSQRSYPNLSDLVRRCSQIPAFARTRPAPR